MTVLRQVLDYPYSTTFEEQFNLAANYINQDEIERAYTILTGDSNINNISNRTLLEDNIQTN